MLRNIIISFIALVVIVIATFGSIAQDAVGSSIFSSAIPLPTVPVTEHTIVVQVVPGNAGYVTSSGSLDNILYGSRRDIFAYPYSMYEFDRWVYGSVNNYSNPLSILVYSDITISAIFKSKSSMTPVRIMYDRVPRLR